MLMHNKYSASNYSLQTRRFIYTGDNNISNICMAINCSAFRVGVSAGSGRSNGPHDPPIVRPLLLLLRLVTTVVCPLSTADAF